MGAVQRNLVVLALAAALAVLGLAAPRAAADTAPGIIPASALTTTPPQPGDVLTESPEATWTTPPASTSIQWLDCDSTGLLCVSASGPGSTTPTYTVAASDDGFRIEVQETGTYLIPPPDTQNSGPTLAVPQASSTTGLLTVPATSVTNQTVTMIATVTSGVVLASPTGTMTFEDAGAPVAGCVSVPVNALSQTVQVTCQSPFSSSPSPHSLKAVFSSGPNTAVASSASPAVTLAVGRDSTTTALDVSNPVVIVGRTATYTATVAPANAGVVEPSGSVLFRDGGKPISACSAQPLQVSQGFDSAQCTVHYAKVGAHSISAIYSGDGGFNGSASSSQAVSVRRLPVHILGTIVAKMGWLFRFAPKYTQILSLLLHKPPVGTTILLHCHGVGCPFAHRSIRVAKVRACQSAGKHCVMIKPAKLQLATKFGRRRLHVGTVVTIELTRHNWIGKAYVFWVRAGRGPHYHIGCVAPGSTKVGVGC